MIHRQLVRGQWSELPKEVVFRCPHYLHCDMNENQNRCLQDGIGLGEDGACDSVLVFVPSLLSTGSFVHRLSQLTLMKLLSA